MRAGPLAVRTLGEGDDAVVLLHGLTGSGDGFGGGFGVLASASQLVIPDLLGFGASMDVDRTDFSLEAHLSALDEMLAALDLDDAPLTVVGHSMGAVLALHWPRRDRPPVGLSPSAARCTPRTRRPPATSGEWGCWRGSSR
jgi:pimeloyl-ACP methyl ester carboxylesterase